MQKKNSEPDYTPSDRKSGWKEFSEVNKVSFHSENSIRNNDSFNYKAQATETNTPSLSSKQISR